MGWLDRPSYIHLPGARRHLIDDVGDGFWFGTVWGSTHHLLRGLRHSPNGDRLAGGVRAVRANVPRVAGSWAAFWGLWCAFENAAFFARRRDDPWNVIAGAGAASAFVELRRGARVAARAGVSSAVFVALIEGLLIFYDRRVDVNPAPAVKLPPAPPAAEVPAARPALPAAEVPAARPAPAVELVEEAVSVPAATRPAATVDRLGRPLGYVEPPQVREPRGFMGVPMYAHVVKEVPASSIGY